MRSALIAFATLSACASAPPAAAPPEPTAMPKPPVADKRPTVRTLHGETFADDYFWLRDKDSEPVLAHLRAEAAYADALMTPLGPLRETLFSEIVSHIAEDDETFPVKDGAWRYWKRTVKGQGYPIYLRRAAADPADPEAVVLDMNALAAGKAFLGLGDLEVSDDGQRLLYTTDETGFRSYDLRVRDLASGQDFPEVISKVVTAAWAAENDTIIYVIEDAAKRPYRAYRHQVGTDPKHDVLLYEETDARFELYCWRTTSRAFVVLHSESKLATEVRLLDARRPAAPPLLVAPRAERHEYHVEHAGERLFIRTNDRGSTFRIVTAPLASPARASWRELVPHDPAVMIADFDVFADVLALELRQDGLPHLELRDHDGGAAHRIALPDPVYDVALEQNPEFSTRSIRYAYQSLAVPRSVYAFDLDTRQSTLLKEDPVPGGFDRTRYVAERVFAQAADGAAIPISLVRRRDVPQDGSAPLHLYGYGAYGISIPASFKPERLTLLDRGLVFAIAHVRGGGEIGKPWHEAGRLAHKHRSFSDFIAAAEALIAGGHAARDRITIEGHSAGGLLMGGVLNQRPDLFKAAIVGVPFVDVINTMNDPTLPLTITEYEEWGNPQVAEHYGWIRAYSPYENLRRAAYPPLLVKTSYNDSQVMYWEPAKYIARLRELQTGEGPVIFKIHLDAAGHGGKSGRYDRYKEIAYDQAFLLWQHGL